MIQCTNCGALIGEGETCIYCQVVEKFKFNQTSFVTKDSGERQEFTSGMVRDSGDKPLYTEVYLPLVTRHAELMMRGAKKYGKGNWKKVCGEPEYERFKESLLRHVLQYVSGDRDEDHLAAVLFNCHGAAMVEDKLKESKLHGVIYTDRI